MIHTVETHDEWDCTLDCGVLTFWIETGRAEDIREVRHLVERVITDYVDEQQS